MIGGIKIRLPWFKVQIRDKVLKKNLLKYEYRSRKRQREKPRDHNQHSNISSGLQSSLRTLKHVWALFWLQCKRCVCVCVSAQLFIDLLWAEGAKLGSESSRQCFGWEGIEAHRLATQAQRYSTEKASNTQSSHERAILQRSRETDWCRHMVHIISFFSFKDSSSSTFPIRFPPPLFFPPPALQIMTTIILHLVISHILYVDRVLIACHLHAFKVIIKHVSSVYDLHKRAPNTTVTIIALAMVCEWPF